MPIGLHCNYQTYSTERMDRFEPRLTHVGNNPRLLELKSEKQWPIGLVDDSGGIESKEDILQESNSESDFVSTCRSDPRWSSMLECSDIEDHVSSPECLADKASHPLSHEIPGRGQPLQPLQLRTTLVTPKSLFLSPIHVMTSSVVNAVNGHGVYGLAKPLLMRTHDIKKVCIEDNEPLKKAIVAQGYSKTQHLIRHSSNPTCIEPFINSIKYPTAKSCNSPDMDRLDKSRLGVVCLCKECHELDPGDVNNSCKNMTDCSEELSDKNPVGT